jgi:hypothetical protein
VHHRFFKDGELESMLRSSGFIIKETELVYAKQDLFIVAN